MIAELLPYARALRMGFLVWVVLPVGASLLFAFLWGVWL